MRNAWSTSDFQKCTLASYSRHIIYIFSLHPSAPHAQDTHPRCLSLVLALTPVNQEWSQTQRRLIIHDGVYTPALPWLIIPDGVYTPALSHDWSYVMAYTHQHPHDWSHMTAYTHQHSNNWSYMMAHAHQRSHDWSYMMLHPHQCSNDWSYMMVYIHQKSPFGGMALITH
jgi:hypothetical protein